MQSEYYIEVEGIDISFPCAPYPVQEVFMRKVIECLEKGVNGLLESPTGTGKTLSLLCSTLAWLKRKKLLLEYGNLLQANFERQSCSYNRESGKQAERNIDDAWCGPSTVFLPRIIYSSRTHSQLSQVVQELKRTAYKDVSSIVLGSRDQLCLHPEVSKLENNAAKLTSCKHKVSSHTCPFYLNYENKLASKDYQDNSVLDIEDLVNAGRKNTCCPYYAAKSLKSRADIIFTPYNYLLDPKSRTAHGIELNGNIIIFDEAHNIENICEDSMSFQLRSADLARCINEVTQVVENIRGNECSEFNVESTDIEFTLSDLSILKVMLCELEEQLDKAVTGLKEGCAKPGSFMFEMLANVGLTTQKKDVVLDLLDKVILYLTTTSTNAWTAKGAGLQSFSDMVKILFSKTSTLDHLSLTKTFNEKYRVYLEPDNSKRNVQTFATLTKKRGWILNYWCFSAEISMKDLIQQGVHSLILTSGTLSPLNSFATELGIPFPVQLENPHIIDNSQVFVAVITQGPDGTALNSSFQNRSNIQYINSLGRTLINFGRQVPDGMLVFFPSYSVLNSTVIQWEESGVWNSLSAIKDILREPQGKIAFQESISQYYSKIENPESHGAVLLAVCRGKVSEGLDFADKNARAVFITGLPFPPSQDPRVKLKISYLDEFCKKKGFSGNDWYLLQASRAVNQAVGRVIRHCNDYGAIVFCDNRFTQKRISSQLSMWLQGQINIYSSFGPALKDLSNFFRTIEKRPPQQSSNQLAFISAGKLIVKPSNEKKSIGSSCSIETEHRSSEDDKIIQSYMPTSAMKTNVSNLQHGSSIFDAMDAHEDLQSLKFINSANLVISEKINGDDALIAESISSSKRRKINVPLHDITGKSKTESDGEKYSLIHQTWKQHLSEVKVALRFVSDYSKFREYVQMYKSDKDVLKFAKDISQLFINIPKRDHYVNIVSRLVSSEHRTEFLQHCSKLFYAPKDESNAPENSCNNLQVSDKNFHKSSTLFTGEAYQCAKCQQVAKVPMMAPCTHVCCYLCWREILRKTKLCPICDKPVKKHNLQQRYFKSAVPASVKKNLETSTDKF